MYGAVISFILLFPWALVALATAGHLRDDGVELRSLGEAQVRGKANAVEVFTLR